MPILRPSGSDFTSFVKAAAQYVPSGTTAKASKSGGVSVAKPGLGAVVRTSQVGALASPTTSAVVINGVTAPVVASGPGVSSWLPTNPVTPLITWLDGTRGLTATTWTNYGTNGGSATISGATGLTTINSLGAINLGNGNMTIPQVLTAQGRAFFMVVKFNVAPTNGAQLIFQVPGTFGQYDFSWRAGNGLMMTNYGYANPYVAPPSSTDAVTPFTFGGVYSSVSTSSNAFYYNTTLQSPILANSVAANFTTGAINAYVNINNGGWTDPYVSMCICELLFYDGNLPLADAASAVSYLKAKWGTAT